MKTIILMTAALLTIGANAQECTNRLEKSLKTLPSWMLAPNSQGALESQCIEVAMDAFSSWTTYITAKKIKNGEEAIGHYMYCTEETIERIHLPHCKTPDYVNSIKNSYNAITDCLGISSDDLYPIIASESGFHLNSFSTIGEDIGLGQLTSPAISDVNGKWDEFMDEIKDNNSLACQNILNFIEKQNIKPIHEDPSCMLTKTPTNPIHNLIYSGFYFKLTKQYITHYFETTDVVARIDQYRERYMSMQEVTKLKSLLVNLSYNMGYPNSVYALEDYITQAEDKVNKQYNTRKFISSKMAQLYLERQKALDIGQDDIVTELTNQRDKLKKQYLQLQSEIETANSIKMFGINSDTGSFGSYLKEENLSSYLQLIQSRVTYISDKSKNQKCAIKNHLQF